MNQYLRIGVMAIPLAALLFIIHGSRYSGLGTNINLSRIRRTDNL